jgi:hypothetical protein
MTINKIVRKLVQKQQVEDIIRKAVAAVLVTLNPPEPIKRRKI